MQVPTFDLLEAKSDLSRLVDAVESGAESEIIILRTGKPVARLVPVEANVDASRRLGLLEGRFLFMTQDEFDAE